MNSKKITLNIIIGAVLMNLMIFAAQTTARENGKIAFVSNRDGNGEIYVMNADGSNQTRLTNNSGHDYQPAWSPDGAKISYIQATPTNFKINVMNDDGSGLTTVYQTGWASIFLYSLNWSPDGTKIIFDQDSESLPIKQFRRILTATGKLTLPFIGTVFGILCKVQTEISVISNSV